MVPLRYCSDLIIFLRGDAMQNNGSTGRLVKGFLATLVGAMLIIVSYRMILDVVFFVGGIILLRRGLIMLNSSEFERIVLAVRNSFNRIFS